jgi:hypothetical protein
LPLGFARFAAFGFILEVFIVEEMLLSRRKDKLRPTVSALDDSILKFWHSHSSRNPTQATRIRPLRTLSDLEITLLRDDFFSCFSCEPAPA